MTCTTNACFVVVVVVVVFVFVSLFAWLFFGSQCRGLKLLPNMINRRVSVSARMRYLKTFRIFCFQNETSNGGVNPSIDCLEFM